LAGVGAGEKIKIKVDPFHPSGDRSLTIHTHESIAALSREQIEIERMSAVFRLDSTTREFCMAAG
jgi:hypothetical protein